jgi:hypothetical protein
LRQAWHDPDVTFESAVFRPETFRPGDDGYFRDPQKSQATMDAQRCIQQSVSEAILHFCRTSRRIFPASWRAASTAIIWARAATT